VRAENVEVSTMPVDGGLVAQVDVVEPTGASLLLTVRLGGEPIKVHAPAGLSIAPDAKVWLLCPPTALRFFDTATGLALLA
jgi:multiple sugar transport system ATP-binding protein